MTHVFISYARKDSSSAEVGALVQWLKAQEEVEVISDHLYPYRAPPQGWYAWMQHSIEKADIVLCICGEVFKEAFEKKGGGKGVAFESGIVTADLHGSHGWNEKFHPILPRAGAHQCVPKNLEPWDNNIALADREKILALIREVRPPTAAPPGIGSQGVAALTPEQEKRRRRLLTPMSVCISILVVLSALVVLSGENEGSPVVVVGTPAVEVDTPPGAGGTGAGRELTPPDTGDTAPGTGDTPHDTGDTAPGTGDTGAGRELTPPDIGDTAAATGGTPHDAKPTPHDAANNPPVRAEPQKPAENPPGRDKEENKKPESAGSVVPVATPPDAKLTPPARVEPKSVFSVPHSLAVDRAGNLYVADSSKLVLKLTRTGVVSGFIASSKWGYPQGIVMDAAGNLYVADSVYHRIHKEPLSGVVSTLAGSKAGFVDDVGNAARFHYPHGITIDAAGNLYVADSRNHRIRRVTPSGAVSTLAGSEAGFADGVGDAARFREPRGITIDAAGNLYVADYGNHRIRKVTPSGVVSTLAGGEAGFANGLGSARFRRPHGISIDKAGNLYVADSGNHRIRKVTPSGAVSTLAGSEAGFADGVGGAARFHHPRGIAIDAEGNLYVADSTNNQIRKVTLEGEVSTFGDNQTPDY